MPTLTFQNQTFEANEGETVLDVLTRYKANIPFSCRSGLCQSCLMTMVEGDIDEKAQSGLKETLKSRNLFLSCQQKVKTPITIETPNFEGLEFQITLARKEFQTDNIVKLQFSFEGNFDYKAGQYVNLIREDGTTRPYSLASHPDVDKYLEFHIKKIPDGKMSSWLFNTIKIDQTLTLRGPMGNCFYVNNSPQSNIILIGVGTGLAPLYGIMKDALYHNHKGNIVLYHGGLTAESLYLMDELKNLAAENDHFQYKPCVLKGEASELISVGNIEEIIIDENKDSDSSNTLFFICGDPPIVESLKKKIFLAGASFKNIYSDPFIITKYE